MHKRVIKGLPLDESAGTTKIILKPSRIIPNETVMMALDAIRFGGNRAGVESSPVASLVLERAPENGASSGSPRRFPRTQKEIEELIGQRTQEIETRKRNEIEQAYKRGLDEGRAQGHADALGQIGRIEKTLNDVKDQIVTDHEAGLTQFGSHLGRLALLLAESVISRAAAESSGDILQHNLRRCLEALKGSGRVLIRINPIDYEFIKDHTKVLENSDKGQYSFEFEPDPSISPGGCYLETDSGAVDGRLESQFELLKSHFLQLV